MNGKEDYKIKNIYISFIHLFFLNENTPILRTHIRFNLINHCKIINNF